MQNSLANDGPTGALARGLRLLAALNDLETATISGLVKETNLPKATVIRLLQALQAEGYAAQDTETLTYRVTPKVASLSRSLIGKNQTEGLIQVALDLLADELKWPAEYLVQDGLSMLIQSNNRERAPIKLKLFERRRFPILESAAGVSYLSSLSELERGKWLKSLLKSQSQITLAKRRIEEAAQAGYATRSLNELGPNMRVAAVPVPGGGGAISMIYLDDVVAKKHLETVLLPVVRKAAVNVAGALQGKYPS
ncbi:IclR family transcriptional regulator [Afipia sp. GAS231]|uniref:IclR family transcriptional regulator n=1 Tax=Afipia sp. GAS231 TaxID=1882747 RepID=UPI00087CFDC6|nr:helix-turn-helix domain-containing protein [Afipia sp. GAS231]SDO71052.1 IclR family transcriptional regulator, mhp operon transcriptional activator [Afipia sp. GAS231]